MILTTKDFNRDKPILIKTEETTNGVIIRAYEQDRKHGWDLIRLLNNGNTILVREIPDNLGFNLSVSNSLIIQSS